MYTKKTGPQEKTWIRKGEFTNEAGCNNKHNPCL